MNTNFMPNRKMIYILIIFSLIILQILCDNNLSVSTGYTLFAIGDTEKGQLGIGDIISSYENKPIGIPLSGPMKGKNITYIQGGGATTMFLDSDGNCYGTGYNINGQLGIGSNTESVLVPVSVPNDGDMLGKKIRYLSVGYRHTLFVSTDNNIYSAGSNDFGQLCLSISDSKIYTPKEIIFNKGNWLTVATGYYHSAIIDQNGFVYSCGLNGISQLGNNDDIDSNSPINTSEFGDLINKNITQASAGYYHSIFLDSDGNAYGTGFNGYGQLGTMNTDSLKISIAISTIEDSPLFGKRLIQISAGADFSLFLTSNGEVYSSGHNLFGTVGNGKKSLLVKVPFLLNSLGSAQNKKIIKITTGYRFSVLQDSNSNLHFVGNNNKGQAIAKPDVKDIIYITQPLWENVTVFGVGMSTVFVVDIVPCKEGEYFNRTSKICTQCPNGFYCLFQNVFQDPSACEAGKWSNVGSYYKIQCFICPEGFVCNDGHKMPCQADTWGKDGKTCSECPLGYICPGDGTKKFNPIIFSIIFVVITLLPLLMIVIIILIFGITCVICFASFFVYRTKRMIKYKTEKMTSLLQSFEKDYEIDILDPEVSKVKAIVKNSLLEIQLGEITVNERIGNGGGDSIVYKGHWNNMEVAIKLFKASRLTGDSFHEEFQNELIFMNGLRHPRLVSLYGCCLQYPRFGLVMEYCSLGSVYDNIQNGFLQKKDKQYIYKILIMICEGMIFLHKRGVVHRDLKNANVLLTSNGEAKIADFGLSRHIANIENASNMTGGVGTSYYVAPEVVRNDPSYNEKCDIYSFSIMMIEIVSGRNYPYPTTYQPAQIQIYSSTDATFRPDLSLVRESRFPEMEEIIVKSWSHDPQKRPSFEELIESIRDLSVSEITPDVIDRELEDL